MDIHTYKSETVPFLIPFIKTNWKQIKDLNKRPGAMKLLEENIGIKLLIMGLGNISYMTTKAQAQNFKTK